jgi:general secretion pathway protein D
MTPKKTASTSKLVVLSLLVILLSGCTASRAFRHGEKFERRKDYDAALQSYRRALERNPRNLEYRLRYERVRLRAALAHLDQGRRLKTGRQLEEALAEFQNALTIDPSLASAAQEATAVQKMIVSREEKLQRRNP